MLTLTEGCFSCIFAPRSRAPADSRAASHCARRGAKVALILLDESAKAAAHCLHAAGTRLCPQKPAYFHSSPICFLRLKYIILLLLLTQKAAASPLPREEIEYCI